MPSEIAAFGKTALHVANHPFVLIGLALPLFFGVLWALSLGSGILRPVDRTTSGVIIQSLLGYGVLLIALSIGYAGWKTYREALTETGQAQIEAAKGIVADGT